MSTVLQELAGNGRGQQVLAATMVVALTTLITTGMNFWWTSEAENKLNKIEAEAQQARRDLAVELRRDIQNAAERLQDRAKVIEDRIARMDAVDTAIQSLMTQELRQLREDIGRRVTVEEKNDIVNRRNTQMQEFDRRLRELETQLRQIERNSYRRGP